MAMKTLEYLRGISAEDCRKLRARGIRHTNQLLHVVTLDIDRQRLSSRTGISPERLLEFGRQCALLEISGMERFVPIVRRLGITSLKILKQMDSDELHAKVVDAVGLAGAPALSMVQYWISQARTCDTLEEPEATPAQWDSHPPSRGFAGYSPDSPPREAGSAGTPAAGESRTRPAPVAPRVL